MKNFPKDTYSPVATMATIRLICCEAYMQDLHIDHWDIKTAYLYGELDPDDEIYMTQPPGYRAKGKQRKLVCRLKRGIYGLKNAGLTWYKTLTKFLTGVGFNKVHQRPLRLRSEKPGQNLIIIIVYVDDLVLAYNSKESAATLRATLAERFKMKDLGPISEILGIQVTRTKDTLTFSQEHYAKKVLGKFGIKPLPQERRPPSIPFPPTLALENQESPEVEFNYRECIGCLLYLSTGTRPDLTTAVSTLARYQDRYRLVHVTAAKKTLLYLAHTIHLGLTYHRGNPYPLFVVSDSDFRLRPKHLMDFSRAGYCVMRAGAAVLWKSTLLKVPSQSTAEAEYRAGTLANNKTVWATELLKDDFLAKRQDPLPPTDRQPVRNQNRTELWEPEGLGKSHHTRAHHELPPQKRSHDARVCPNEGELQ